MGLKQLDLFNSKDSELIRTKEDDSKMEDVPSQVDAALPQRAPQAARAQDHRGQGGGLRGGEARGEGGGREQDGEQELLQEVHPAQGCQARRCGLESLL